MTAAMEKSSGATGLDGTERIQDVGKLGAVNINRPSDHDTLKKPDSQGKLTALLAKLCGMQSDGTLDNKEESGHSTKWGGAANYVNATVGAGIIGLPYALHNIGFYAGLFFLCLSPYFICTGSHYLGICGDKLQCFNYEALMRRSFSKNGYYAFSLFCFLNAVGACTAYVITMTDTITEVAAAIWGHDAFLASRTNTILVMGITILLPISLVADMHRLAFTSALSVFAVIALFFLVCILGPIENKNNDAYEPMESKHLDFVKPTLFAGLGGVAFTFVSQQTCFIIYRSLKEPSVQAWSWISNVTYLTAFLICGVAISGYLSFGDDVEGDVLNNFGTKNVGANIARLLLAITMFLTYPLEVFIGRHVFEDIVCQQWLKMPAMTLGSHVWITLLIWAITIGIAILTSHVGIVLELVGAICATNLGYTFPSLLYLKVHSNEVKTAMSAWNKDSSNYRSSFFGRLSALKKFYLPSFIVAFGVATMIIGTATTFIYEL